MKKVEKLALAGVVILLLFCALSFVLVFFSDSGTAFMKALFQFQASSRDLKALESRYPFRMPEDKVVSEERLKVFLEVCREVKPSADRVDAYRNERAAGEHGKGVVFEGVPMELSASFLRVLAAALEAHRMGPTEWQWIANQMEFAKAGPKGTRELAELKQAREELERLSQNPAVTRHEQEHLKREVSKLESAGPPSGAAAEANAALYARYADRIQACSIGERCRIILNDALPSLQGQEHIQVFVVNPSGPGAPPTPAPPLPPRP